MNLLEKYRRGGTLEVYDEMERMGSAAFNGENLREVHTVVGETMNRVAYNLDVIYAALLETNYCFKKNPRFDFERPILKPRWGAKFRVRRLEKAVSKFGHVPLSLKMFIRIVGACNFTWDYEAVEEIPWEGADPIEIIPISDLLQEIKDLDFEEDDEEFGLPVSGDYLHKDNTSGGPMYRGANSRNSPKLTAGFFMKSTILLSLIIYG